MKKRLPVRKGSKDSIEIKVCNVDQQQRDSKNSTQALKLKKHETSPEYKAIGSQIFELNKSPSCDVITSTLEGFNKSDQKGTKNITTRGTEIAPVAQALRKS